MIAVEQHVMIARCDNYLRSRTGKYEWRCERYAAVAEKMLDCGLSDNDTVIDVGAGWTELDVYLRDLGWRGRYLPIDGGLDGTDIEHWVPPRMVEFIVAVELLEHLDDPFRLVCAMEAHATKLVAMTTPNPLTTDVIGMDPTHKTEIWPRNVTSWGWQHEIRSFYGQPEDSILGWRSFV